MVWIPARLYTGSQWAQDVLSNIRTKRGGSGMKITTIGIDLAKSVFAVSGADSSGIRGAPQRKFSRAIRAIRWRIPHWKPLGAHLASDRVIDISRGSRDPDRI